MGVTVAEDVVVKLGTLGPVDVFDNVGVLEDVGRKLICNVNVMGAAPVALKLWSKLESASDVTSPQIGTGGSEIGSPTYVASKFNNGILSDIDSEGCKFPTSSNSINVDKGTIEHWAKMKFASTDADYHWLWSFVDGNNGGIYLFFHPGTDTLRVGVYSGSSEVFYIATSGVSWSVDDLLHLAVTWDREGNDIGSSKTVALYVNNVEEASSTTTWNTDTVGTDLVLGLHRNEVSMHSDVVADNIKTYNIVKIDFSDKDTESVYLPGEGVSVAEVVTSRLRPFIDVFDSPSLTEDIVLKYPGDRSFSTFDNVGVVEDVTSRLLSKIDVFDASVLSEYLRFTGRLGDVDVYDSVSVVESFAVILVSLISEYEEVTVVDAASALAIVAGISTYEAVSVLERIYLSWWQGIVKEDTTWSDISKDDTEWSDIPIDDTEWSNVR